MQIDLDALLTCPQCGFAEHRQIPEWSYIHVPVAAQYYGPSQEIAVSIAFIPIGLAP